MPDLDHQSKQCFSIVLRPTVLLVLKKEKIILGKFFYMKEIFYLTCHFFDSAFLLWIGQAGLELAHFHQTI